MNNLRVVEEIMRETKIPMSARQIVEHAAGRLPTRSRIPVNVVGRDLAMDIKNKGAASIFIRTEVGRFTLRELCHEHKPATSTQATSTPARSREAQKAPSRARSAEGARQAMRG